VSYRLNITTTHAGKEGLAMEGGFAELQRLASAWLRGLADLEAAGVNAV